MANGTSHVIDPKAAMIRFAIVVPVGLQRVRGLGVASKRSITQGIGPAASVSRRIPPARQNTLASTMGNV